MNDLRESGLKLFQGVLHKDQMARVLNDAKSVFLQQMNFVGIEVSDPSDEAEFSAAMFKLFKQYETRFIGAAKLCQNLVSLHQLSLSDNVLKIVKGAGLKFPTISTRPTMFFNSPFLAKSQGFWKTPPHQDWRSMQGSLNSVVLWVPLIDINRSLGALELVPGSLRHGLLDSTEDDFYRKIDDSRYTDSSFHAIETTVGDCLLFSAFTVHRSGTNSTARIRWSCHFRYNDMQEPSFIERNFPNPYLYKPQQDLITPNFPAADRLENLFMEADKT